MIGQSNRLNEEEGKLAQVKSRADKACNTAGETRGDAGKKRVAGGGKN